MTTNNNNRIPELRFPGFTGEWVEKKLGEILCERRESSVITEELPQLSFTIESGVIRPEDRKTNKRDFLMKDKDNKKFLITRKHDIIYNPANVVFGAIHKNNLCDGVVSPIYKIFWTNENADVLNYILRRPQFISTMATHAEGTVTKLKTLKSEAFLDLSILLPPTLAEQQKIADCLSSLDEEIAAEAQKADALKDHKKGLMQQLFPAMSNEQLAISNCVPKLRFPGFEGEWVMKKLGEVIDVRKGQQVNNTELSKDISMFPMLNGGSVISGYYTKYNTPANSITISEGGNSCGYVNYMKVDFWAGGHCYIVDPIIDIKKEFLFQALKHIEPELMKLRVGSGLPNIQRKTLLQEVLLPLPPTLAEQQKIADCLSELDEMISAQQQKVEALKEHKKGLMQKLFPKMSN